MRCKFHPCDPARVGVCSTCLRERLEVVAAERERRRQCAVFPPERSVPVTRASCPDFSLPFPRSVSPYASVRDRENLFFSTPQVNHSSNKKHFHNADTRRISAKEKRFPSLSAIFGRHKTGESQDRVSSSQLSSWFSFNLPFRQKKSRLFPAGAGRNLDRKRDSGMSPAARGKHDGESTDDCVCSATMNGEAAMPGRRTMQQINPPRFAVCLSPLMRPNTDHRLHEQYVASDVPSFSGDVKCFNSGKHPSGRASSTCDRSRKLCDLGKSH